MYTELIRLEADNLEYNIRLLMEEFIKINGPCDIQVESRVIYDKMATGKKLLVRCDIDVRVTI